VIYSVNYSFVRRQADKNRSRRRKSNGGFRVPEAKAAAPLLLPSVSQSGAEDRKSGAKARRDVQGPGVCRCERAAPQRVLGLRVAFCAVGVMFASFLSLFLLSVLFLPPCLRAFFFSSRVLCFRALETISGVVLDLPVWKRLPVMSTSKG